MKRSVLMALVAGSSLFAQAPAPAPAPAPAAPKIGELERLGENGREMMILGVDAPGFDKLRPSQRKLAYFLYRAAIAGDEISYLQNHRYDLEIKNLLETLYAKKDLLDAETQVGLDEYLKLVWANHGHYRFWEHNKFVPRLLTFDQLRKAAHTVQKKGAKFELKGESLDKKLARLKPHIFDPAVEPVLVNDLPGQDPIATSASGLYDRGLTLKDIQALPKEAQEQLNVRFAKKGRKAVAQVAKVGGAYGEQLANVAYWLEKALPYVEDVRAEVEKDGQKKVRFVPNPDQKEALEQLIDFLKTGDEATFKKHCVAWLKTKSTIDYLAAFEEVYKDPRAVIGAFEANVSFKADSATIEKLSQNAAYFEAKMPWKEAWKRTKIDPPVATVVNVVVETADAGPMSAAAYNLPNYADIRKEHGSKNVVLLNIEGSSSQKLKDATRDAFYLPADRDTIARYGDLGRQWEVYMHEVIGHGSGQPDASLAGVDPAVKIGGMYSGLEECRADCVALYQFPDPKVGEILSMKPEDQQAAERAMYLQYLTRPIIASGRIEGDSVREAHDRGRQLVLNYLVSQKKGVQVVQQDGHAFVQIDDMAQARQGIGEILDHLQTYKAMGDKEGAEKFFADYGTVVNKDWQKDAKARLEALNMPKERAFVFPKLVPVTEMKNEREVLKDVKIESTETFAEEQARFKKWGRSRELDPK
ncbi:MAG TPA: hypothetical protein VJ600_02670, partial [Holophagaceae bacterium]|nr:hypothetical protein [Holophagaceae bacterium]